MSEPKMTTPPQLQKMIERELKPDEQLYWIGQQSSAHLVPEMISALVLAFFWTLISFGSISGCEEFGAEFFD